MRAIVIIHDGCQLNTADTEAISSYIAKLGNPGQDIHIYELNNSDIMAARLTLQCLDYGLKENSKDRVTPVRHACTFIKGLITDVPQDGCEIPKILKFTEVCKNHCATDKKFKAAVEIIAKNNRIAERFISHVAINTINYVYQEQL